MPKLTTPALLAAFALLGALGAQPLYTQEAACEGCAEKAQAELNADLPSAASILDRFVEATGGREAYGKIRTTIAKSSMEMPQMGISTTTTLYKAEPNLMLTVTEIPNMGEMRAGCNGEIAWAYNPMSGPSILEGKAAEEALSEAGSRDEEWRDRYSETETLGTETVEGEECYKVLLTTKTGQQRTAYYSVESGLMLKLELTQETEMGDISGETLLKDYREVGGVLLPFRQIQSAMGMSFTIDVNKIEFNVDIPRSTFDPPDEVMALMDGGDTDCGCGPGDDEEVLEDEGNLG